MLAVLVVFRRNEVWKLLSFSLYLKWSYCQGNSEYSNSVREQSPVAIFCWVTYETPGLSTEMGRGHNAISTDKRGRTIPTVYNFLPSEISIIRFWIPEMENDRVQGYFWQLDMRSADISWCFSLDILIYG